MCARSYTSSFSLAYANGIFRGGPTLHIDVFCPGPPHQPQTEEAEKKLAPNENLIVSSSISG